MRKSKVVAITMGMIASCLFGGYAVVDAATVTLDDSATGTPENPEPISATKTKKTAATETSIKTTPAGIKKTAIKNRNRKLAVTPEKEIPTERAISTTAPVEDMKNTESQTETTTRIFVKSISTSTEIKKDTLRPVSQNQKRLITPFETNEPTEEFEEPTEPTTEEAPEEITEETTTSSEQTVQTTSETEPVTTASTRVTVAEITTAKPKTTTTTAETTSTTKATTTSTTKATTTTTTTSTTKATTTTTTTTSTSTTTTTTTTSTTPEPVITTVDTTVNIPAIQDSEIIDVPEIYLDNILGSEFEENSITIEEVPEVIPETEAVIETEEPAETITIVDTSSSVSDSDYILLCNAVAHEAGSDNITIENKAKVVEVIMNRVYSSSFPNTIYGVITQKSQFSGSSTYADLTGYSSKVTQNVKSAVDLYFYDPSAFNHGYLYFYGDGSQNHFSQY